MVAFCNIESEIYEKAKQQVVDLTVNDSSDDEDDEQSGDDNQGEGGSTADEDPVFELDGDINLESLFLQSMLLDMETSLTSESGIIPAVVAGPAHGEMKDWEPTEDDWENM